MCFASRSCSLALETPKVSFRTIRFIPWNGVQEFVDKLVATTASLDHDCVFTIFIYPSAENNINSSDSMERQVPDVDSAEAFGGV